MLCPAIFENGGKTGIDLVDLQRGEKRRLGERYRGTDAGQRVGAWVFDPAVLAWGNLVLAHTPPTDILIIDELGSLEFEQGGGFQAGLDLLDAGRYQTAYVVIRPELLVTAIMRWPQAEAIIIEGGLS